MFADWRRRVGRELHRSTTRGSACRVIRIATTGFRVNWKVSECFLIFSRARHATVTELYIMGRAHTHTECDDCDRRGDWSFAAFYFNFVIHLIQFGRPSTPHPHPFCPLKVCFCTVVLLCLEVALCFRLWTLTSYVGGRSVGILSRSRPGRPGFDSRRGRAFVFSTTYGTTLGLTQPPTSASIYCQEWVCGAVPPLHHTSSMSGVYLLRALCRSCGRCLSFWFISWSKHNASESEHHLSSWST